MRFTKVMVWDLDGTLYKGDEFAEVVKKIYITHLANSQNISYDNAKESFDSASHELARWSLAMSRLCKEPEECFIRLIESSVNKGNYIEPDTELVSHLLSLKNYRHIILTNGSGLNTKRALLKLGFPEYKGTIMPFEKIFTFDNDGFLKPDLKAFEQVIDYTEELPQNHLFIGDSLITDILPAAAIQMRTILIGSRNNRADFTFPTIASLYRSLADSL